MSNLIDSLHQVVKQKFWSDAMHYTKELFIQGKVVEWSLTQQAGAKYAEWMAGEPASWKAHNTAQVSWKVWSMPSPTKQVGNSWTGGSQSIIDEGNSVTVTPVQAASFIEALKQLTEP
jgi:hypothetical protein